MAEIKLSKEAQEIAYAKLDNNLLDDIIMWMLAEEAGRNSHILCWLIEAKQYRNLEMEFLK